LSTAKDPCCARLLDESTAEIRDHLDKKRCGRHILSIRIGGHRHYFCNNMFDPGYRNLHVPVKRCIAIPVRHLRSTLVIKGIRIVRDLETDACAWFIRRDVNLYCAIVTYLLWNICDLYGQCSPARIGCWAWLRSRSCGLTWSRRDLEHGCTLRRRLATR